MAATQPESPQRSIRHVLTMVILCLAGGTIFNVVYVFEVYYLPLQQAMGLSKSQMGMLLGVFGAFSMLSYGPGGWLADRFSSRKLITIAMVFTGGTGFLYAGFPSYPMALALHALWGVSISLVFWNALIKATRNWAPSEKQGRAFGFLEAGRGLFGTIGSTILLGVFTWMGSTRMALATVISGWSAVIFLCGVAAWFVLQDDGPGSQAGSEDENPKVGWNEVVLVLKMPAVWLIAMVIIATNSGFWATYLFTPYASEVFLLSVAMGGLIGVARNWINPLAPFISGFVADRFGISKTSEVMSCVAMKTRLVQIVALIALCAQPLCAFAAAVRTEKQCVHISSPLKYLVTVELFFQNNGTLSILMIIKILKKFYFLKKLEIYK